MKTPISLRKQIKVYEAHGFHAVSIEPRAGSHWCIKFAEFIQPQIVTVNAHDPRALKNNISRYKQLAKDKT